MPSRKKRICIGWGAEGVVRGKKHVVALGMVWVPGRAGSLHGGVVRCEAGKAGWREVRGRT